MWVYPWPSIRPVAWDDKDFEPQQILDHIRGVLERPEMNENSGLSFNDTYNLSAFESLKSHNVRSLRGDVLLNREWLE